MKSRAVDADCRRSSGESEGKRGSSIKIIGVIFTEEISSASNCVEIYLLLLFHEDSRPDKKQRSGTMCNHLTGPPGEDSNGRVMKRVQAQ